MITKFYKTAQRTFSFLILLTLITGSLVPATAQTRRTRRSPRLSSYTRPTSISTQPRFYTIPAHETIRVRMNEQLSSETARIGDRFTTTVVDPVYAGGIEVVPAGSKITGRVTDVQRAGRRSKAGSIGVTFISLQMPNGATYPVNGSLTSLSSESVNYDNEGQVSGRSSVKRNTVFIGGGAATGALIGAISGGGRGAGVGAGVGAGLGVAGALFSKGEEAVVKRDTEFGVILDRNVSLPASNVR